MDAQGAMVLETLETGERLFVTSARCAEGSEMPVKSFLATNCVSKTNPPYGNLNHI